jgi:hypothetical protein
MISRGPVTLVVAQIKYVFVRNNRTGKVYFIINLKGLSHDGCGSSIDKSRCNITYRKDAA